MKDTLRLLKRILSIRTNIYQYTLKFISNHPIKKKKVLNIYYNNPKPIKLQIPQEYTALYVLKRLNDLFDCTGDLYTHFSKHSVEESLNLYLHPQTNFYYVPHGQIFQPSSRLGTLLNIPPPRVLKGSFNNGYNFAFFNCNGLPSATDGINNFLENSDVDVLIAFET